MTDIISDAFSKVSLHSTRKSTNQKPVITIPVMILWKVKIPLHAKFSIGAALSLSLFMMIIAIMRVSLGNLAPGVSDIVWIYFCWNLESSTAVFMVSATAFRSTFGHHQSAKAKRTQASCEKTVDTLSGKSGKEPFGGIEIPSTSTGISRSEGEEAYSKTGYQLEVDEMYDRRGGV